MNAKGIGLLLAAVAALLPLAAAQAQFNGSPRRAKPRPPAPAPVYTPPPPAPAQPVTVPATSAQQPAAASGFDLPPPPVAAPGTAAPPPAEAAFRLGRGDKVIRFRADNPSGAIAAVSRDGQPMQTRGLGSANAEVLLKADPEEGYGTPCDTDGFEVRLSNGVIWRPMTNFCNSNDLVGVPSALAALPSPLPAQPSGFGWQFSAAGMDGMLAYGIPESDATALVASCRRNSGRIEMKFVAEAGTNPRVDIYGPDAVWRLDLTSNEPSSDEEPRTNAAEMFARDAVWGLLRQGLKLPYRLGTGPFAMLDTTAGRARINQFVTFCGG